MRLFTAIYFNSAFEKACVELQRELRILDPKIKLTAPEQIHLTLNFLGDVKSDKTCCNAIQKALSNAIISDFSVTFGKIAAFFSKKGKTVILEVVPSKKLVYLQNALREAFINEGIYLEKRAFKPHLTLGRKFFGNVQDLDKIHFVLQKEVVTSFDLIESKLYSAGPVYTTLKRFDLK